MANTMTTTITKGNSLWFEAMDEWFNKDEGDDDGEEAD